ncbi:MAG: sulfatase, partial [Lentisphaeraceae bacterium]|nr:sulfatase [Lentisphaeraceae bacterium]
SAVCSPSRATLITGRHHIRAGVYSWIYDPSQKSHLKESEITIAEVLKTAGYVSARFGKWHVGDDDFQGFDISDCDGKGKKSGNFYNSSEVHQSLTDASCAFIEKNKDKPFFLFLSHWDVHLPLKARKEIVAKYKKKLSSKKWDYKWNPTYAAMIEVLDKSVARVQAKLKELNLDKNTLFIFTSDNGGHAAVTTSKPLRGAKGAFYEGGVRVPTFMVWPTVIKAGTETNTPITSVDFLPTFAKMAQAKEPTSQPVDGVSILPLLRGKKLPKRSIFWHYPLYLSGVKEGKVIPAFGTKEKFWRAVPSSMICRGDWKLMHFFEDDSIRLYNVAQDIAESKDLSKENPEIAQKLFEELKAWQKETKAVIPDQQNPLFGKASSGKKEGKKSNKKKAKKKKSKKGKK